MYWRSLLQFGFCLLSGLAIAQTQETQLLKTKADSLAKAGNYQPAAQAYRQLAYVWAKLEQPDSVYQYRYRAAETSSAAYQYQEAAEIYEELIGILEREAPSAPLLGKVYYGAGSNFVYLSEFDKGLTFLNRCLTFENQRPNGDSLYIAKAKEWKGLIYSFEGKLQEARQLTEEAHALRKLVLPPDHKEVGYSFNSLGNIYFELNAYQQADSAYREALRILSLHLPKDHPHLSSIAANYSNTRSTLGDVQRAKELLLQSIAAHRSAERVTPLMSDYFNLGGLFLSLDDTEQAILYMSGALELADSILPYPHASRANFRDGLGAIFLRRGQLREAKSALNRALQEKKALFGDNHPEVARSYYSLGLVAQHGDDLIAAENYFRASYAIRVATLGADHPQTADALTALATIDWASGDTLNAMNKWRDGFQVYTKTIGLTSQSTLEAALQLARVHLVLGQTDSVQLYLRRAWAGVFDFPPERIEWSTLSTYSIEFVDSYVLELIQLHLSTLLGKEGRQEPGDLQLGKQLMTLTEQLLERLLPLFNYEAGGQHLGPQIRRIYNAGALLAHHFGEEAMLLHALEKSRSFTIRAAIQDRKAMRFAGVPDSILIKDQRLREQLRFLQAKLQEDPGSYWKQLQLKATQSWQNYQNNIREQYPEYYRMRYAQNEVQIDPLKDLLLAQESELLAFFEYEFQLLAVIVHPGGLQSQVLSMPVGWQDSVAVFHELSANPKVGMHFAQLAYWLYQQLWQPLAVNLGEQVVLMPDGALYNLNFETLLTALPENEINPGRWSWLLKQHRISYCYTFPQQQKAPNEGTFMLTLAPGFTPAVKQQYQDSLLLDREADPQFLSWSRTPWSLAFAEQRAVFGKALTGTAATEAGFREWAPRASILHFATHAIIQDSLPLLSFLALTPEPAKGDDGYLHAYELYNLPLQAQLAVLTACETGLGAYREGEGVLSLGHAFQYAGCPGVVYSLWGIDDQQSNWLMQRFYEYLDGGESFAAALRKAKLDYLEIFPDQRAAPFYWGGLVFTGEDNYLSAPSSSLWRSYWWLSLLLPVFIFWLYRRRK